MQLTREDRTSGGDGKIGIGFRIGVGGQGHRFIVDACVDLGKDALFPFQPLKLPDTQPDKDGRADKAES